MAPLEERRHVTVVFADVVGSTAAAEELDVEDVRRRLLRFHATVREAIERHGGGVEKYIGDAVVGIFGAEAGHEDDPMRAVRAALEARDAIVRLQTDEPWLDLHVRVGAATGEALVAIGAQRDLSEGVVTGDVLNTAARIQSAAPPDGVLVGAATYHAARNVVEFRSVDAIVAKGKAEPIEVWEALALRARPLSARSASPLVGRADELARLETLWRGVLEGRRCRSATLVGPAGAGKSRLVDEVLERADALVLRGRCLAYGEGITYWPLAEALADMSEPLGAEGDERAAVARALAALVSEEPITQGELHWGLTRHLELIARERPTVLVVEDVHWAEPTLLELIESFSGLAAPLLVVTTTRPEGREPVGDEVITLEPLSESESLELVQRLLGDAASPTARRALVERAAGNPLFLEETARTLEAAPAAAAADDLPLPSGVQALIGARLDRLPVEARRLLGAAAVVGTVFWDGALERLVSPRAVAELEHVLGEGLVHARPKSSIDDQRELAFHHDMYRDVAYARLPKGVRAEMHIGCADWLDDLPGALELVELVASHLERACLLLRDVRRPPIAPPSERAAAALEASATRAELREGYDEAERYLARAIALLTDESRARDALAVRRAGLSVALGRLEEAAGALTALAEDDALAARSPVERGRALVWLANIHFKQSRAEAARACLDEADACVAATGDAEVGARAAYERSVVLSNFDGNLERALAELARGRELARRSQNAGLALEGRLRAGFHLYDLARMDEAADELRTVVEEAEALGRIRDAARARMELGYVRRFQRATEEAEALARQAQEPLVRTGDRYFVVQNLRLLSELALDRGDGLASAAFARESVAAGRALGSDVLVLEAQKALVDALVADGLVDEAREVAGEARADLPPDDRPALLVVLQLDAVVAAAAGDVPAARALSRRLVELADEFGRVFDRVNARVALARVLGPVGDPLAPVALAEARALAEAADAPWLARHVDAVELGERIA